MNVPSPEPRQWFSAHLEYFGAMYAAWTLEQLELYNAHHPPADWSVDVEEGLFRQGGTTVRVAPLGTLGTDGSWVWAWANEHMHPPGSSRLSAARILYDFGEKGIPELATPRLELTEFADAGTAAERLLLAVTGMLYGYGYATVPTDTGAHYAMLVIDDALPRPAFDLATLPRRLMQGTEVFPHNHSATVDGYLRRHGFDVAAANDGTRYASRPDCTVRTTFDPNGRISDISAQNTPG
ncbi:hypothetical protein FHX37_3878 [Haloactinospora alba]|uniref:Uncharacterized protein n=1 Tax=Haloactinospora alba TaxID=405555 RepID=A0A543N9P0_9ACTN|nr:DUF6882 domain-containing protein [Haloactinospora alba]TQN28533.1 hypothetical protein FHX37_3878 [Haloactinospora alba]